MGLAKRRLYKPERRAARKAGVLHDQAPVMLPDASAKEIAMALYSLARESGFVIGQGGTYDSLKDSYVCIGKSATTGRAQDLTIEGSSVADVITLFRLLEAQPPVRRKIA